MISNDSILSQIPRQRILLLNAQEWFIAFAAGVVTGLVGMLFSGISPWIPLGFVLPGITIAHMILACRHSLPLPQTAVLIATIYYLIAPLANHYYPAGNPLFIMADPEYYFSYAVPCLWSLAFGWFGAFYKANPIQISRAQSYSSPSLLSGLDGMLAVGVLMNLALSRLDLSGTIATVGMLLANMRYIGAFGWIILARKGWKWRLLLVLALEMYTSVASGFFLNFLLWTLNACVVIMFRHRLSTAKILIGLAAIALLMPCFQFAKWELRRASWGVALAQQRLIVFGDTYDLNALNKAPLLMLKVLESGFTLLSGAENDEFIADTSVRYNQGWIVDKVQQQVPSRVDFAGGTTVLAAAISSVIPRFLMPDKLSAGGAETFTRYSGVQLNSSTSMNLGFMGEMFANFGYGLGIVGCGFYSLFLGFIFRKLIEKSHSQLLLLSFIPYILNFAVVSEVGLVDVLNYTVKSTVVAFGIYLGVPIVFRRLNVLPTGNQCHKNDSREYRRQTR